MSSKNSAVSTKRGLRRPTRLLSDAKQRRTTTKSPLLTAAQEWSQSRPPKSCIKKRNRRSSASKTQLLWPKAKDHLQMVGDDMKLPSKRSRPSKSNKGLVSGISVPRKLKRNRRLQPGTGASSSSSEPHVDLKHSHGCFKTVSGEEQDDDGIPNPIDCITFSTYIVA